MSDARSEHEKLVEDVARHMLATRGLDYGESNLTASPRPEVGATISTARTIVALILYRLHDVTPEMVEGWRAEVRNGRLADCKSIWRAMLAASPLNGEKS